MATRARTRKRAPNISCQMLLGAALALVALITLTTRVGTTDGGIPGISRARGEKSSTTTVQEQLQAQKKSENEKRRDFVTLQDIQLVGSAAVGLLSPGDDHSTSPHVRPTWPPQAPWPASQASSPNAPPPIPRHVRSRGRRSDLTREESILNPGSFNWPYLHAGEDSVGKDDGGGGWRRDDTVQSEKSAPMKLCEVGFCWTLPLKRCEARQECAAYDDVLSVIFYDDNAQAAGLCTLKPVKIEQKLLS
jgi:hypothetical protein